MIEASNAEALEGKKGAIALKREAQKDIILPYSKVGKAGSAIKFLKRYAPTRYLALAGKLAGVYTEQTQFQRSMKLLRALIGVARKGAIDGKNQSYMAIQFQRQIAENAKKSNDKESTVAEIAELIRIFEEEQASAPKDFMKEERRNIKDQILQTANEYHKEYNKTTHNKKTLEYTQLLYDEYLRLFRSDENACQISMNNALLMLSTEKYQAAAAEFEKVIDQCDEYDDNAAERAVIAYLKSVQVKGNVKNEEEDDLRRVELESAEARFVHAIDRWMAIVKRKGPNPETKDNIPLARFASAKVHYNANQFAEAGQRFIEFTEQHPSHHLFVDAARHALSAYNLSRDVDNLRKYANLFEKNPRIMRSDLKDEIQSIRNAFNFQECFVHEKNDERLRAAKCFEKYAQDFPQDQERAVKAVHNAGINYFEAQQVEKALKTQKGLYDKFPRHPLAPKVLYSMGDMFRRTTVYDQAAVVYELFVKNHPKHKLAEKALRFASIYRKTLGNDKEAIKNLQLYLKRYGDKPNAPRVHLDILAILEGQNKPSRVIKGVAQHLRTFENEPPGIRLQVLNKLGLAYQAKGNMKKARRAFADTVDYFNTIPDNVLQDLKMPAISAIAESHFYLGDASLKQARRLKFKSSSDKAIKKTVAKKLTLLNETKTIYEKVIAYGHPGWTIAASSQLGLAFRDLADKMEDMPTPKSLRNNFEAEEQFRQQMSDQTGSLRKRAIAAYKDALTVAKRERWFNKYSEAAEAAISELDLTDLSIKEFRLRPDRLNANGGLPAFAGGAK